MNPDCQRHILLTIASHDRKASKLVVESFVTDAFDAQAISECLEHLIEQRMVNVTPLSFQGSYQDYQVRELTANGQRYLESIRNG